MLVEFVMAPAVEGRRNQEVRLPRRWISKPHRVKNCKTTPTSLCQLERTKIAQLTTEIVAAYVSYHQLRVLDVPSVINAVGTELASLGTGPEPIVLEKPEPAVSVRRSVQPDHLACLICGKKQKLLKRHLAVEHELTPRPVPRELWVEARLPDGGPELRPAAARTRH